MTALVCVLRVKREISLSIVSSEVGTTRISASVLQLKLLPLKVATVLCQSEVNVPWRHEFLPVGQPRKPLFADGTNQIFVIRKLAKIWPDASGKTYTVTEQPGAYYSLTNQIVGIESKILHVIKSKSSRRWWRSQLRWWFSPVLKKSGAFAKLNAVATGVNRFRSPGVVIQTMNYEALELIHCKSIAVRWLDYNDLPRVLAN